MEITSRSNERIKFIRSLKQQKYRKESGLHLIEGERLVCDAILSGAQIQTILVDEDAGRNPSYDTYELIQVSRSVLESLSDTKNPQHVLAVVKTPVYDIQNIPDGFLLALDALQDPGNLGTILRSADAFGVSGVLLGEGCCEAFSPKAVRSSMGSCYHLPIVNCSLKDILEEKNASGYTCVCGHLKGSEKRPVFESDKRILVIGNEGNGVSEEISSLCTKYRLPMKGRAESLNAAVAASVLLFLFSE